MIKIKVKELMERDGITRYRLQKLTNWNFKRINSYYFDKVIEFNIKELDQLCDIFKCQISDILEKIPEQNKNI